ncbi:MAG: hypothetical protein ACYDD5_10320, partial [Sulfuricurvum sp.]
MSALKKPTFAWKVTFHKLLNEQSADEKMAEEKLIATLAKFSSSSFKSDSWVLDNRSNKAHPDTISFMSLGKIGNRGKHLAKLFLIATLNRGGGHNKQVLMLGYYQFLSDNQLNLHQVKKDTLAHYMTWLDAKIDERSGNPISEKYKHDLFKTAIQFHTVMNGHSFMAEINGVQAIENPYDRKSKGSKYKVIEQGVLDKLDIHFKSDEVPIHTRVTYWIMRLFATRPEDTLNYPLDCVKKLTDDMATIKHAVVKNSSNKGEIEYKLEFLNLQEPMQKMLFELIETQQLISQSLQISARTKGFLFTYQHATDKTTCILSTQSYRRYINTVQAVLKIPELKRAVPRDFKKTGIWNDPQIV